MKASLLALLIATPAFAEPSHAPVPALASASVSTQSERTFTATLAGRYHVTRLRGTALVWIPSGTAWETLRLGDVVPEGTLLQLAGAGKVVLDGRAAPGGDAPPGVIIDAEGPVFVRLDRSLVRKVEFGGYFLSMPLRGQKVKTDADQPFNLREAFERTVAIFDDAPPKTSDKPINATDIDTGGGGGPGATDDGPTIARGTLVLSHPRKGDTYLVAELPTTIAVQWADPPEGARRYAVAMQRLEKNGKKQRTSTTETFHRFEVAESGRYRVTVETEDGRWRSAPHTFEVKLLER